MAVVTTVVNLLVILVLSTTKRLRNSQSTYKLSLAAADLMVGVLVLPTCIYNFTEIFWRPLTTSRTTTVTGYKELNGTFIEMEGTISTNIRRNLGVDSFSLGYIKSIGVMTVVSILASIYTLAAAGFDRLYVVYKSLSYDKVKAIKYAKIACVISWILAVLVSLLPIVTPSSLLSYRIYTSLIVAFGSSGPSGVILYSVVLFIPLTTVWIVNIMVYLIFKKHTKNFQQKHRTTTHARVDVAEKRLATTLCLMVGVFTFNTLPVFVSILSNLSFSTLNMQDISDLKRMLIVINIQLASTVLLLGNSLCNFFIYNARNKDFRKASKCIIKSCWQRGISLLCSCCTLFRRLF